MNDAARPLDAEGMKWGLLMEGAELHQRLAEAQLEKLRAHTADLDTVVRDTIRRAMTEELRELALAARQAVEALDAVKRAANWRALGWQCASAVLCTAIPLGLVRLALPSAAEVAALRAQRDALAQNVARLEQRGGRIAWRRCGADGRLCVRVDRKAPAYGEDSDYYVVKGY